MPTAEEYSNDPSLKAFDNSTLSPADQAVAASYASPTTSANTSSSSSGDSSSPSQSVVSQINTNPQTGTTGSTAGSKPSWMGNMYSQDAQGYWSTNPGNPNAERFTSDGRPVATVGYTNAQTGTHYNGYATPEQFQQIQSTIGNPQAEESLLSQWLKSGVLNAGRTPTSPVLAGVTSVPAQLKQYAANPMSTTDIQNQMQANSDAWNRTTDPVERDRLHSENVRLGAMLGSTYDPSGTWGAPNASAGYDYLNQQGQPVSRDGSLHVTVNGQPAADVPVYQGSAYGNLDQISKQFGVNYKIDPNGIVTVNGQTVKPIGYDHNGIPEVGLRDFAQAAGLQVDYNDDGKTVKITGAPKTNNPVGGQGGTGGQGSPFITPHVANTGGAGSPDMINGGPQGSQVPGAQQDPMAAWNSFFNSQNMQMPTTMPIQQQFNPDWTGFYNQAHAQIDPLYQSQYNNLMSKQASDISGMDQKMNARGIFTSGIAQAAEDDLRAKTTNSVATLFTKQMSDIEKTAQALEQQAYKQYNDGNQFALKYNQDQITNYMNQQKQLFTQWLGTQKLDLAQQQYALSAWDKMATLAFDKYKFDNPSAGQMLPYKMGPTPQQKIQNNMTLFKMLGYVQNPDGTITPTEQATNDKRTYAVQVAKMLGYMTNPDGSIVPTEQAKQDQFNDQAKLMQLFGHDAQGNPTLDAQKLQLEANHWANQDALSAQRNQITASLGTARLNQQAADAAQRAQQFSMTMQNTQWGKQLQVANEAASAKFKQATILNNELMNIDATKNPDQVKQIAGQIADLMNQGNYIVSGMMSMSGLSSNGTQAGSNTPVNPKTDEWGNPL